MKTHRNILFISLSISIISLIFVICLNQNLKGFQIALAFMGSAFISFMLELPIYISLKNENANKLYFFLSELKTQTILFKNNIDNSLCKFDVINEKFYEKDMEKIMSALNNLKSFDLNYFPFKKKNYTTLTIFNNITAAYNNLNQSTMIFPIEFNKKKIEIIQNENNDRNISPNELIKSLNCISTMCSNLIDTIDSQALLLLSKRKAIQWSLDDLAIKNIINSFNIDK